MVSVLGRRDLERKILDQLIARQAELGLTVAEFTQYLNVNRDLYEQALRLHRDPTTGKGLRLGPTLAAAVLSKFPDMHGLITGYLLSYNDRSSKARVRTGRAVRTSTVDGKTEEAARD